MEFNMKYIMAVIIALGLSTVASAEDLNQVALQTIISNSKDIELQGDVHPDETVLDIYNAAITAQAKIENECTIVAVSKIAKCVLMMNYSQLGGTSIEYVVNLPGTSLASNSAYVSRGD
jgi:NDP-sugar pyrophosphorylase family protein